MGNADPPGCPRLSHDLRWRAPPGRCFPRFAEPRGLGGALPKGRGFVQAAMGHSAGFSGSKKCIRPRKAMEQNRMDVSCRQGSKFSEEGVDVPRGRISGVCPQPQHVPHPHAPPETSDGSSEGQGAGLAAGTHRASFA